MLGSTGTLARCKIKQDVKARDGEAIGNADSEIHLFHLHTVYIKYWDKFLATFREQKFVFLIAA